jgi:hypothetical protein
VHALKNAAVPIVTVIGIGIALLIGGAVVTESVFAIPGLGRLTVDAILRRDYPGDPGRRAAVQLRLRAGQPGRRPPLHPVRPEDPVLSTVTFPLRRDGGTARGRRRAGDAGHHAPGEAEEGLQSASSGVNPTIAIGGLLVLLMLGVAVFAPFLFTTDPTALAPAQAHARSPSAQWWFGTDMLGRDVYSRVIYGTRVSLTVGFAVAI